MLNDTRTLATVAAINHIHPINGADAIECGVIRSWPVVIGKGQFRDGDEVLYIEPDAALPVSDPRFAFLVPRGTKTIDDVRYHVLRTIRLRGQLSQGIVFPVADFPETVGASNVDEVLGIRLYEPPAPPLGADQIGPWNLHWLKKTDAERVQNLSDEWLQSVDDGLWVATEKVDGSSITYALDDADDLHIYSRNWELSTANPTATPVELATRYDVRQWMLDVGVRALQGEMYGVGINANRLKASAHQLAAFAAWGLTDGEAVDKFPLLYDNPGKLEAVIRLDVPFPRTVDEALALADGRASVVNPKCLAEGIVWHHVGNVSFPELDYRLVFKAVSPAYLIKHGL